MSTINETLSDIERIIAPHDNEKIFDQSEIRSLKILLFTLRLHIECLAMRDQEASEDILALKELLQVQNTELETQIKIFNTARSVYTASGGSLFQPATASEHEEMLDFQKLSIASKHTSELIKRYRHGDSTVSGEDITRMLRNELTELNMTIAKSNLQRRTLALDVSSNNKQL